MFTGIIEEIGKIKSFSKASSGATLVVNCHTVLNGTNIGDSIAINGVCETVTDMTNDSFTVRVSDETLFITTLAESKQKYLCKLRKSIDSNFSSWWSHCLRSRRLQRQNY